ncbi:hypothetical protein [Pantoea sp.]|uniref:hypothetical protein n=1 Tax=Pantoea sp. TaxID=69393 RepID=UPI0031D91E21
MPIKAINTPVVAQIPPTLQELKTEKKRIASEINLVFNKQDELKFSLEDKRNRSNRIKFDISQVKSISTRQDNDPLLRLKNGFFKNGENQNFIKKHLYKNRYASERRAAAQAAGSAAPEIRVKEAVARYQHTLSAVNQDIHNSQNKINELVSKLQELLHKENAIERALEAHTPGAKRAKTTPSGSVTATAGKALTEDELKRIERFGVIYHTNSGCYAINSLILTLRARYDPGNPEKAGNKLGEKVIREYEKAKGPEIFYNNPIKKYHIENEAVSIHQDITPYAKLFYNNKGKNTITTYRGEYMTQEGINELNQRFKNQPDAVYEVSQFYSTSSNQQYVKNIVYKDPPQGKGRVIFTLTGNSSRHIYPPNGLAFDHREDESLYSPLACFRVSEIKLDGRIWRVSLQETVREEDKDRYIMPH